MSTAMMVGKVYVNNRVARDLERRKVMSMTTAVNEGSKYVERISDYDKKVAATKKEKYYDGCPKAGKRMGISKSHVETLIAKKLLKASNISTTGKRGRWRIYEEDILDYERRFRAASNGVAIEPYEGALRDEPEKVDFSNLQRLLETAQANVNAANELKAWKEKARKASELLLEASVMLADLGKE